MDDRDVITINRRGVFSLCEAQKILPVVKRITAEFSARVELLIARLETIQLNQTETICTIEKQINDLIHVWNEKMKKLGAQPRGLWIVDFDDGDGFLNWKHPEDEIDHWHPYDENHSGRLPLSDKFRKNADRSRPDQFETR